MEEHFVHRSQPVVYPFLYAVVSPYLYDSILIHQKLKYSKIKGYMQACLLVLKKNKQERVAFL